MGRTRAENLELFSNREKSRWQGMWGWGLYWVTRSHGRFLRGGTHQTRSFRNQSSSSAGRQKDELAAGTQSGDYCNSPGKWRRYPRLESTGGDGVFVPDRYGVRGLESLIPKCLKNHTECTTGSTTGFSREGRVDTRMRARKGSQVIHKHTTETREQEKELSEKRRWVPF